MLNDVTFFIKTFERPSALYRLIKTICKYYENPIILIVDDSKFPLCPDSFKKFCCRLTYHYAGYDVGLSKGRNIGIDLIDTKYFLLLDDDFFFTNKTKVEVLYGLIEKHHFDILGFDFYDYGICKRNFQGVYSQSDAVLTSHIGLSSGNIQGIELYDFVLNCFIGNTAFFKLNQWDEYIKIGSEHDDFFFGIKSLKPKIAHTVSVSISHYPMVTKDYNNFRKSRFDFYFDYFLKKHGLTSFEKKGSVYSKFSLVIIKLLALKSKVRALY